MKSDAYLMYVRPILEYAACSWAPNAKCNIDKLESVQRRAARFVNGDYRYTSSVTEMINTLRWNSLHSRRDTLRLQMMYKITHHIIDLKLPNYITTIQELLEAMITNLLYPLHGLIHTSLAFSQPPLHYGTNYQLK